MFLKRGGGGRGGGDRGRGGRGGFGARGILNELIYKIRIYY